MSAGRCAWIKLCIGSLLHWPFFLPLCYLSTSALPPRLHPRGVFFLEITADAIASIVVRVLLWGQLCVFFPHTPCSAIYRLALRALEGSGDRGGGGWGGYRWSMDQPWIVGPQNESKCKQGEEISERRPLNCATNRMSTVAALFGLREKWSGERQDGTKAERFRGDCAYAVSGSICLSGSLLRQQVFHRVLDSDALVHSFGIF